MANYHAQRLVQAFLPIRTRTYHPGILAYSNDYLWANILGSSYCILDIHRYIYGWDIAKAGLGYIALGLGITTVSQLNGYAMDRVYKYMTDKNGGGGKPEYRL